MLIEMYFIFRATTCLINAIEHTHDAVEITRLDPDKSDTQVHVEVCMSFYFQVLAWQGVLSVGC